MKRNGNATIKRERKVCIKSFNGLRFYFSILVFLNHLTFFKNTKFLDYVFETFFHNGGFSVLFFFLLSGFCFALGYGNNFNRITRDSWLRFLFKRIKKIYPLYMLTMIVAIILSIGNATISGSLSVKILTKEFASIILGATMTQAWIYTPYWGIGNSAAWFISSIFFLYLITPFLLNKIYFLKKKQLIVLTLVAYLTVGIIVFIWRVAGLDETALYVTPWMRIPEYCIGISCGYIVRNISEKRNITVSSNRVKSTLLELISILLVIFTYWLIMAKGYNMNRTADILAIPIQMFMIVTFAVSNGIIADFLGNKVNSYLGSISMNFYLIHFVVITGGSRALLKFFGTGNIGLIITSVLLFIITLLFAVGWKKFDDNKIQKLSDI